MLSRPKLIRPDHALPWRQRPPADAGMSTVEYAIGTIAAAAFGAILYTVVTGGSVVDGLTALIHHALEVSF